MHESNFHVCCIVARLWQESSTKIKRIGCDNGCHLWESINKRATTENPSAAEMFADVDILIDAFHLKGHKREFCKTHFNPKGRAYASKANTTAAGQAWR